MKIVWDILDQFGLKIKPSKCKWCKTEAKLGHVSGQQIKTDPAKTIAIGERKPPSNAKKMQQFLGICNYYKRFVKGYAAITAPIEKLLENGATFVWGQDQQHAFEQLKTAFTSYSILRQPNFDRQLTIYTDASYYALSGELTQKDNKNQENVIYYISRRMKGPDLNYTIREKECLAVVYSVKPFRYHLFGTEFTIVTDHAALAWLMTIKEPTGRLARWAIYLQANTFTIVHRKGLIYCNADTLSRHPKSMLTITEV